MLPTTVQENCVRTRATATSVFTTTRLNEFMKFVKSKEKALYIATVNSVPVKFATKEGRDFKAASAIKELLTLSMQVN